MGLRSEIVPNLQTSLALWYLKFNSELVFVGDAGTTQAGRPSKRYGIELNTHYTPMPWLLVDLDLARTHARFSETFMVVSPTIGASFPALIRPSPRQ